jgi:hypothetical protein
MKKKQKDQKCRVCGSTKKVLEKFRNFGEMDMMGNSLLEPAYHAICTKCGYGCCICASTKEQAVKDWNTINKQGN